MDARQYELINKGIKIGLVLVGSVAAIVIGKRIYTRVAASSEEKKKQNALDQAKEDAAKKEAATITDSEAATIAAGFYAAMEGYGTDESTIRTLMAKLKNKTDWASVAAAFGNKDYGTFGKPLASWSPSTPTNLYGWLLAAALAALALWLLWHLKK